MAKQRSDPLDQCFQALAHPVRRGILERLDAGPATVGDLAAPYALAAPTISKHLRVLERAGLVARERVGRERHVRLRPAPLVDATSWLVRQRRFWDERLDALDELLDDQAAKTKERPI